MRIAMIGLGDIAQKAYLPLMASNPHFTPVLCTRNASTLVQLQQQYRIAEGYQSIDALLQSQPDAVMIHSSTDSHYPLAKRCLEAGIPVFVDKPLSYQLDECEALLELAEHKNLSVIAGFNRRFAPLYQEALSHKPIHVHYQKNRYHLPDDARIFIYDDFIHVLDFVRHCSGNKPTDINVFSHHEGSQLGMVNVQWQQQGALFCASMNRVNGMNEERLEYYSHKHKWQIDNLRQGVHLHDKQSSRLDFDDWQPTLYKRGFVDMLEDMRLQLEQGGCNLDNHQAILHSHQLCEEVIKQLR